MKRNVLLLFMSGMLAIHTVSYAQDWTKLTTNTSYGLNKISFVSDSIGWAVGEYGVILKTNDAGATWTKQSLSYSSATSFKSAFFISKDTGWALGMVQGSYKKFKTTDGGINWIDAGAPGYSSIYFFDSNNGFTDNVNYALCQTVDGGRTWQTKAAPEPGYSFKSISYVSPSFLVALSYHSQIMISKDGAASWKNVNPVNYLDANINKICFVDSLNGWAIGTGGRIYSTLDGGLSWTPQNSNTTYSLSDIYFVDAKKGWVVGDNGVIRKTVDGGQRWDAEVSGTTERLLSIASVNASILYVSGAYGGIFKTTNGGGRIPELISPKAALKVANYPVKLEWKPMSGLPHFQLQISDTVTFTHLVLDRSNIADTVYVAENLPNKKTYYWRISDGEGWSGIDSFKVRFIGGTKTIDNRLPTTEDRYGSFTEAVNDLQSAYGILDGGVTFEIPSGQYFNESLVPILNAAGSATRPIIFRKTGTGANPLFTFTLNVQGGDYITFDGLTVKAVLSYAVNLNYNSNNITIKNCLLSCENATNSIVINASATDSLLVDNNRVLNFRNSGINIQGTHCLIQKNTIAANLSYISAPAYSIYANTKGLMILDNIITLSNSYSYSSSHYELDGLNIIGQSNDSIRICGNDISVLQKESGSYNVYAMVLTGTPICFDIQGNNIHNCLAPGYVAYGISAGANAPLRLINNMISVANIGINLSTGSSVSAYFNTIKSQKCIYSDITANLELRNNILVGTSIAHQRSTASVSTYSVNSDYNLYSAPTIFSDGVHTVSTMDAFRELVPLRDLHSISKPVTFAADSDLHLAGASIGDAALAGAPMSTIMTDIDGDSRHAIRPYIGADEVFNMQLNQLIFCERSHTFGDTKQQDSLSAQIFIRNIGMTPLAINSGLFSSGQFFIRRSLPMTVPANDSAALAVVFIPASIGTVRDTLVLQSDSCTISLPLTGISSAPALVANKSSVRFVKTILGTPSTLTVTLQNSSQNMLTIDSASTATKWFSVSHAQATLGNNDSLLISVTFTPDSMRTYLDTLSIWDNSGTSPFRIPLSGASPSWQGTLTVTDGLNNTRTLVFGQNSDAGDGIDAILGEEDMPPVPPSGVMDARFLLPVTGLSTLCDYRNDTLKTAVWRISLQTVSTAYPVTLKWTGNFLSNSFLVLKDEVGGGVVNVDMKSQNSFALSNTGVSTLRIEYSKTIVKTLTVPSGWTIVSVPVTLLNMSPTSVFSNTASSMYSYSGGYITSSLLSAGKGYWLKFSSPATVTLTGAPVATRDVAVSSGWNMIGCFENDVPVSSLTTVPANILASNIFAFDRGYAAVSTLVPGNGYWVKVSQAGTLKYPVSLLKNAQETSPIKSEWTKLTITDRRGESSTLFLGAKGDVKGNFELPPVPPQGIFDARFASDMNVEDGSVARHMVRLHSAEYPLAISVSNLGRRRLHVSDAVTGKLLDAYPMEGDAVIVSKPLESIVIEEEPSLPIDYELGQNYPNPFNPATQIRFSIPNTQLVTLKVYDVLGKEVATIVNEELIPGYYTKMWDASKYSSGIYFYRLQAGGYSKVMKMQVLK